ncbi:MAG: redoxin domain-containing protein [Fidelibacterota bacterium]|nr:MAG: redoxin domain-containing protein [Candidatus Neomarinimicrobiota bacterium]
MTSLGIIVLVIISVLVGFFINSVIYHAREGVKVGRPAPAFTGELLDGSRVSQADWNRTPQHMLLCFVSPMCSVCRRLAPFLDTLNKTYSDAELNVLLLGIGGNREVFRRWKDDLQIELPVAVDVDGTDRLRYAVYSLPAIFLISPGGIVQMVRTGFRSRDEDKYKTLFQKLVPAVTQSGRVSAPRGSTQQP